MFDNLSMRVYRKFFNQYNTDERDIELQIVSIPDKKIAWKLFWEILAILFGLLIAGGGIAAATIGFMDGFSAYTIISLIIAVVGIGTAFINTYYAFQAGIEKWKMKCELMELADAQERAWQNKIKPSRITPDGQLRSMFDHLIATEFKQSKEYLSLSKLQKKSIDNFYKVLNREQWQVTRARINDFINHYPTEIKIDFYFHRAKANFYLQDYKIAVEDCAHYILQSNGSILANLLKGNIYRGMAYDDNNHNRKIAYYNKAKNIYERLLRQLEISDGFKMLVNLFQELKEIGELNELKSIRDLLYIGGNSPDLANRLEKEINDLGLRSINNIPRRLRSNPQREEINFFITQLDGEIFRLGKVFSSLENSDYITKLCKDFLEFKNNGNHLIFTLLIQLIDNVINFSGQFLGQLTEVRKIKKAREILDRIDKEISWIKKVKQHPVLYAEIFSALGIIMYNIGRIYGNPSTRRDYYISSYKYLQEAIDIMSYCKSGGKSYLKYDEASMIMIENLITHFKYFKANALVCSFRQEISNINARKVVDAADQENSKNELYEALNLCDEEINASNNQNTINSLDMNLKFNTIRLLVYETLAAVEENNKRAIYYDAGYQIVINIFNGILEESIPDLTEKFIAFSDKDKESILFQVGKFLYKKHKHYPSQNVLFPDFLLAIRYLKESLKYDPNNHINIRYLIDLYQENINLKECFDFIKDNFIKNNYLKISDVNRCYIDIYYARMLYQLDFPISEVKNQLKRAEDFIHQYPELRMEINKLKESINHGQLTCQTSHEAQQPSAIVSALFYQRSVSKPASPVLITELNKRNESSRNIQPQPVLQIAHQPIPRMF